MMGGEESTTQSAGVAIHRNLGRPKVKRRTTLSTTFRNPSGTTREFRTISMKLTRAVTCFLQVADDQRTTSRAVVRFACLMLQTAFVAVSKELLCR